MTRARRRKAARRKGPPTGRVTSVAVLASLGFAVLVLRAFQLQAVDAERLKEIAAAQSQTTVQVQAPRRQLLDRNGHPLAVSAPVASVAASPRQVRDRRRTAQSLARALGRPVAAVNRELDPKRSFRWIQRWVDPEAAERIRALELPGIHLHPERRRFYPHGSLAAAYIGFAGHDGRGLSGLELLYEAELGQRRAAVPALRDARGRALALQSVEASASPDLWLTLDRNLSHVAAEALAAAVDRYGAKRGSVVALDPNTGDVLAVAEVPSFDPNAFWREDASRFRARGFVDTFEPGSTLKPFVIALALDAGVVEAGTSIDCENGRWRVLDRVVRDFRPQGVLSVADVVRVSSNIGAGKIANRLGSEHLVEGLRAFGFGQRTGSGFPGEARGQLRGISQAQAVERANLAFGQGISVTAVQLASAGAALANGGYWIAPRLRVDAPPAQRERVVSERTARSVVEMMRGVVEGGTGRAAALPHLPVAGKTGTAQKVVDGRYSREHYVASFLGLVPAVNPRLVVVVVLDEPVGAHTGGRVAAPVFREVAKYAVEQFALPAEVEGAE